MELFLPAFVGVWLITMAYVACVAKLNHRLSELRKTGQAPDVPTFFGVDPNPAQSVVWLLTGRYAGMADPVVSRWGRIARVMFFVALPLVIALFAWALTLA